MFNHFFRLGSALLLGVAAAQTFATEVTLGTNVSDFEHFHNRGGGSVEHVECIFSYLGYLPNIQRMPWRRARQEVSIAKIDGFFTAIPTNEVEKYATLSAPLLLENWYWYWPAGAEEPEQWRNGVRLGVILGSHQAVWLEQQGYPIHLRVNSLSQLVKLMLSNRIDAFIADREHMAAAVEELNVAGERYRERFLRYMPLGVYFGNEFLAERPTFLTDFNAYISHCADSGFVMSAREQEEVHQWLQPLLSEWIETEGLVEAIRKQNRRFAAMTDESRDGMDRQWREAFQAKQFDMVLNSLELSLSDQLRALAVDADGLITEVILTDQKGLNVAVSDMTTDFWQGDENKFQGAWSLEPGQLHFGPVRYDESTQRFQVNVSRPVFDPDSGQPIGVLIVGVDIDRALSRSH